jgi:hypothetical protein
MDTVDSQILTTGPPQKLIDPPITPNFRISPLRNRFIPNVNFSDIYGACVPRVSSLNHAIFSVLTQQFCKTIGLRLKKSDITAKNLP